jgi:molecular chaperone Hsp33
VNTVHDYLVKALAYDGKVRAYACRTTNLVSEAQKRHDTWVNASAALGRTMTAAVMMGAMQKGEVKITVKVDGGGPLGPIIVDSNSRGEVRGYVTNPNVQLDKNEVGKIDVKGAVGTDGTLTVTKDLGLRDHFTGQVHIVSGEIGEDFTYYFVVSEQTPSSVGVGVLVNPDHSILAAGGFILQLLPDADEYIVENLENTLKTCKPVSTMIREGYSPEEILEELLGKDNIQIIDKHSVCFKCTCSKERFENAIIGLGKSEIQDIIEEDGQAEVHCHFCNDTYIFTKEELEDMHIKSN